MKLELGIQALYRYKYAYLLNEPPYRNLRTLYRYSRRDLSHSLKLVNVGKCRKGYRTNEVSSMLTSKFISRKLT